MIFCSYVFLCFFLPVVLVAHTLFKNTKVRNALLILASLVFYAYGEPVFVILLLISVFLNYIFGLLVGKVKTPAFLSGVFLNQPLQASSGPTGSIPDGIKPKEKGKKPALAAAVIINIGFLFVFKYLGFFLSQLGLLLPKAGIPQTDLRLPIGISFYTFQALSYVTDVYRGRVAAQKSFFKVLLYISFFPQLIAGPIVIYHDIETMIDERSVTAEKIKNGIFRFMKGLCKKILIANVMAKAADTIFVLEGSEFGLLSAWVGSLAYIMQIYFDFSGYSDMAIGLGRMFGFEFLENFNHPYIAGSVRDFWRRWHISLSSWFRDYLYIPLGGNRKGKKRAMLNRYIVFACTGIWHGANWTFLIWGLWHGTITVIEGLLEKKPDGEHEKKLPAIIFGHVYTMLAVIIGFCMFRADTLSQGFGAIKAMFGFGAKGGIGYVTALEFLSPYYLFIFALAVFFATDLPTKFFAKLKERRAAAYDIMAKLACIISLILCYLSLAGESYNPFIYFRF